MKKLSIILALLALPLLGQAAAFTRVTDPTQVFDYVDADGIRVVRSIPADGLGNSVGAGSGITWGQFIANSALSPSAHAIIILAMPGFKADSNALRVGLSSTAATPADVTLARASSAFTFTATGTSQVVTMTSKPASTYALQVKATGSVTSWTVNLQASLDGLNWTTVLTHTNVTPADGAVQWQAVGSRTPGLFMRAQTSALTLGAGTNVIATLLAMQ